ncbi:EF-hand domain-containing protein [Formosa sp. L2A11]|uniref:EF-hand domain-containing protein n=1 Tax=Formosa sp. L2A11 TaxID=2686363 RepID=UPI00131D86CE|nr:EF-hand domain-containing protein [Formosa sp. L2A11]
MKTMNSKIGLMMVFFCLAFVGVSHAQQGGGQKEPPTYAKLIKEMDVNDDGKLEESEVKGPLKDDFSKIDTDEDGYISEKEFEDAPKPSGKRK